MLLTALCLCITSLVLLYVYLRVKTRRMAKLAEKIPGPKPTPFWKIFTRKTYSRSEDMIQRISQLSEIYKSTFCFWKGPELFVFIQDIKHIAALLADSEELGRSCAYKHSKPWLGSSLLLTEGEQWKGRRKLIAPEFRPTNLETSCKILNGNIENLLKRLTAFVGGPEFDVHQFMNLHALDNVWETFMGAKVDAQDNSESKFVKAITNVSYLVHSRLSNPLLHQDFIFNMSSLGRRQARDITTVRAESATAVDARRRQLLQDKDVKNRVPILDTLIELLKGRKNLEDLDPTIEISSLIFAGYETTAAALGFACWLLSRHPDVQEKVYKEQQEIFGDSQRLPTYRCIQQMKYLEMVIKETLRLYPTVPLFGRKMSKDFDVGDFIIPAGANVMFLVYQIHRNSEQFPDPENFDPDRFLPDITLRRNPYSYLAFSAGPRNCVGMKFGLMVAKGTMSALIRRFKILPGTTPLSPEYMIMLKSRTGMRVRLEFRDG